MKEKILSLIKNECLINGEFINHNENFDVINPYDESVITYVPALSGKHVNYAIESAYHAFDAWANKTAFSRADILLNWFDLIIKHKDIIAGIITLENGKIYSESISEIEYAASFIPWSIEEAKRLNGEILQSKNPNQVNYVQKKPIGVVGAITPWNLPAAMILRKVAPALSAGCTVVVKPAELTPLTALYLGYLAFEAGIPKGVLNVVTGEADMIGKILTSHPYVRKISFTGSTEVGKLLAAQSATTMKSISMELGGNAPFIIYSDADLELAATHLLNARFRNSGQMCICANRIFIEEDIYATFIELMKQKLEHYSTGDGFNIQSNMGPLIDQRAVIKMQSLLDDATNRGANIEIGGRSNSNNCFPPTIVTNVTKNMRIFNEEIFGPITSFISFNNHDEMIQEANNTPYGLAAYIFTRDIKKAWQTANQLEYGMVAINNINLSSNHTPFGGMKESGIGRENSHYGVNEFVEVQFINMEM